MNGFIALKPIPEPVFGRRPAALPLLALGRRSGRVPALPYPPPGTCQCTSQHWGWSHFVLLSPFMPGRFEFTKKNLT